MFPQVAAKFFAHRAEGPKNVSKAAAPNPPRRPPRLARPATARARHDARVTYQVRVGDKTHKVTVEPA